MREARVFTHPVVARRRFQDLVEQTDERIGLSEASLVIALEEYPGIDVESYLGQLQSWATVIRDRTRRSGIEAVLEQLNRLLYEEEGFHGEADDYYDPRGTFLNEVLDRHAGVPLALSIVYIELSRRAGLHATGVSIAGRVLVRVRGPYGDLLLDPWDQGRVLSTGEIQALLDQVYGGAVRLREELLRDCENREILAKVLAHLKAVYLTHSDLEGAIGAIDRLLLLDARDSYEIRDRGLIAMQIHRYQEAIDYLDRYLELTPYADDARQIRESIDYLRQWLGRN